jgi:hypothetical protein
MLLKDVHSNMKLVIKPGFIQYPKSEIEAKKYIVSFVFSTIYWEKEGQTYRITRDFSGIKKTLEDVRFDKRNRLYISGKI